MRRMLLVGPMVAAVLVAAGAPRPPRTGAGYRNADDVGHASRRRPRERCRAARRPRRAASGGTPVTGEVKPAALLAEIVADAALRSGVAEADIVVVRGESVTWSDGSLGCPQPGMNYTQALVPGYWVVLDADGTEYDYRASARGFFTLCESGGSPPLESRDR